MTITIIVAMLAAIAVAGVGGVLTEIGPWYRALKKPTWQPPDWAFGPAWSVILGMAAWGGALAWEGATDAAGQTRIIVLFAINALFHILWNPLFFRWKRPDWALIECVGLWLSTLALVVGLAEFSTTASYFLAPYLAWVAFAWVLNLSVVRLNRPFGVPTAV
jgi:tryptophan-rich sensory protein